jgi:hypothetical protein
MSRELPEHVREKARIHLLDTRAAIVSGANLEAGIAGQRYAESLKGLATVAILGTSPHMRQVRLKSPRSASTTMKTGTKSFGDKSLMADAWPI